MKYDRDKVMAAVRDLIVAIGEDPQREGLVRTPERIADMYEELFSGIGRQIVTEITLYTTENQDEMILMRDIPFHSMCEHHLLPFWGTVSIAYVPNNNYITGFSSLARIVELMARQPQLQERMTTQIADALMQVLKPMGVFVVIKAQHMCTAMCGVKKAGAWTVTSSMRGAMRKEATRLEALLLMGDKHSI